MLLRVNLTAPPILHYCPSHLTTPPLPSHNTTPPIYNTAPPILQHCPSHLTTLPLPSYITVPPILQHCPSHLTTLPLTSFNTAPPILHYCPSHLRIGGQSHNILGFHLFVVPLSILWFMPGDPNPGGCVNRGRVLVCLGCDCILHLPMFIYN